MRQRGAITVFFGIIFLCIVIFIGVVVDFARLNAAQHHFKMSADTALFSSLSQYNPTLKNEYGLFGVKTPPDSLLLELIEEALRPEGALDLYGYENISVTAQGKYPLNNPNVMRHQILEHYKYRAPYNLLEHFFLDFLNDLLGKTKDVQQATDQVNLMEAFLILDEDHIQPLKTAMDKIAGYFKAGESDAVKYYNNYTVLLLTYMDFLANNADDDDFEEKKDNNLIILTGSYSVLTSHPILIEDYRANLGRLNALRTQCAQIDSLIAVAEAGAEDNAGLIELLDRAKKTVQDVRNDADKLEADMWDIIPEVVNILAELLNISPLNADSLSIQELSENRSIEMILELLANYNHGQNLKYFDLPIESFAEFEDLANEVDQDELNTPQGYDQKDAGKVEWKSVSTEWYGQRPSQFQEHAEKRKTTLAALKEALSSVSNLLDQLLNSTEERIERLYINEYMLDTFQSQSEYLALVEENGTSNNKLEAQMEYLLYGMRTDLGNIALANIEIGIFRLAFNVIHILTDPQKMNYTFQLASTLAAWSGGTLIIPIQALIIVAWASVESVLDVRELRNGGKIQLLKKKTDWVTDLSGIKGAVKDVEGSSDNGLDYNSYLRVMLLLWGQSRYTRVISRVQDVIYFESSTSIDCRELYTYVGVAGSVEVRYWFPTQAFMPSLDNAPGNSAVIRVNLYRGY